MKRMFKSFQTFGFHNSYYIYMYIYLFRSSRCCGGFGQCIGLQAAGAARSQVHGVCDMDSVRHLRSSERVRLTFSLWYDDDEASLR